MPVVTKSTRGAVGTNNWTNPANATAENGAAATAAPAKNSSIVGDWDFAAFTDGEIPAGSSINSVTFRANYNVSTDQSVASLGIQNGNNGVFDTEETDASEPLADADFNVAFNTPPSLTDVKTAGRLVARIRAIRGNSNTSVTFNLDHVQIVVDYSLPNVNGTAAVSGRGAVAAQGSKQGQQAVTITNRGTVAAIGTKAAQGVASVSGYGMAQTTGDPQLADVVGQAVISGHGVVTAAGMKNAFST